MTPRDITHPLLAACGVTHGFGVRGVPPRQDVRRPRQVHGTAVASAADCARAPAPAADAVVSDEPCVPVGVVTADCVPILACDRAGQHVAAIHAGWRGLAGGVVTAGVEALAASAGQDARIVAVIGPHIGSCCYEVDAPVLDALRPRFEPRLDPSLAPTRAGHARIDLGLLVAAALSDAGLSEDQVARVENSCTRCDAVRFHSYRRDGAGAGRLLHHIAARARPEA